MKPALADNVRSWLAANQTFPDSSTASSSATTQAPKASRYAAVGGQPWLPHLAASVAVQTQSHRQMTLCHQVAYCWLAGICLHSARTGWLMFDRRR